MKVKYNGDTYTADFFDKLRIEYLKMLLILKRQKRRIKIMFTRQDLYLYLLITLFWSAFAVATFFLGGVYHANGEKTYTMYNVLWELKNSYFSSVVLSLVISVYNRSHKYHEKIRNQHFIYTLALDDFSALFDELIGDGSLHYIPFYCDKCYYKTVDFIRNKYKCGHIKLDMQTYVNLQRILERLNTLEEQVSTGNIIFGGFMSIDADMTLLHIKDAKYFANRCMLQKCIDIHDFLTLARDLSMTIDSIRTPWRRDMKTKIKILEVLDKNPENEISKDFYYNMLLNGCKLEYEEFETTPIKVKVKKLLPLG